MGIPKFYRWISERYPCLSQVIKEYQIPEFDHFYLDMNGIIHICSHPNDDDPTFRISEDKIFSDIFNYIEALFKIIKPKKVMFMAVDGVAPRAKMNQQRGRRFRSAREAQDLLRKAMQREEALPSSPRFDSNCITPGTEFMDRLQKHLKYFVQKKLSTDPSWQGVEIILSGQDVPGEGEHKIMDFIRYRKAQAEYDPNTRHCLYGLDADLILLALLSHEPHFCLLREEIRFGRKNQNRSTSPSTVTFHLLHLSILREYLDHDFKGLKDKLSFAYDLEKVIDDWVLMSFLVGNDFLPHLPNMHIRQSSLTYLYSQYQEVLPTLDGYINEGGYVNMRRFEVFLKALAQFDVDHYDDLSGGLQWLKGKTGLKEAKKHPQSNKATPIHRGGANEDEVAGLVLNEVDKAPDVLDKLQRDLGIRDLESYFDDEDEDRKENLEKEFAEFKAKYYREKLELTSVDESALAEQARCYVVGIQWVLQYYYHGVPSWSWFYPYHYAPFVSDIKAFADLQFKFKPGSPFKPFEQLLAVLPPASKDLLPQAFQGLMVNEDSPIKDFYPVQFQTDLNGKEQEWEAVVLIPFIDEDQLIEAMGACSSHLLKEEIRRNSPGMCLICSHDKQVLETLYPSPWPQVFPDINKCKVKVTELSSPVFHVPEGELVTGLSEGVMLDVYFPGFPSLQHIPHSAHLERRGVRVFQCSSRDENVILTIQQPDEVTPTAMSELAKQMLAKSAFVGWPYLVEAKINSLSDGKNLYTLSDVVGTRARLVTSTLTQGMAQKYREEVTTTTRSHIETRGIDIGEVRIIVYAQVLQGKRFVADQKSNAGLVYLHKEWAVHPEPFPYQTAVRNIATFAPSCKDAVMSLEELYPVGSHCFLISSNFYGCQAEVLSVLASQGRVQIQVTQKLEPNLARISANRSLSLHYLPSYVVGNKLNFSSLLLARITGTIQVESGSHKNAKERNRVNVGLSWKFARKNLEIPGYARRLDSGGWSYSDAAVMLLEEFLERFPVMFDYLIKNPGSEKYYETTLFPNPEGPESLPAVREWMRQLPSQSIEAVQCGSLLLDHPQVMAVEKAVGEAPVQDKLVRMRVKPSALFKPTAQQGSLIPDPSASYQLYDRVVNVSVSSAVPFGLRGTIIGTLGDPSEDPNSLYEVLFDEEFLGGLALRCSPNRAYRLPSLCMLNITHGKRLLEPKRDVTTPKHPPYQAPSSSTGRVPDRYRESNAHGYQRQFRHEFGGGGRGRSRTRSSGDVAPEGNWRLAGKGHGMRSSEPFSRTFQERGRNSQPTNVESRGGPLSEFGSILQEMMVESHPSSAIKQPSPRTPEVVRSSNVGQAASERNKKSRSSQGGREDWRDAKQAKKSQENESGRRYNKAKKQKGDSGFSAAMDALTRLDISTLPSPSSVPGTARLSMETAAERSGRRRGGGGSRGDADEVVHLTSKVTAEEHSLREVGRASSGEVEQDLSPLLNAVFERGGSRQQQENARSGGGRGRSPRTKTTPTSRIADSERSAALKNLLHIDSSSPHMPPGEIGNIPPVPVTSASLLANPHPRCPPAYTPQPHISEAVMKLMRPPRGMNSPSPPCRENYSPHQHGTFSTRYSSQPQPPWSGGSPGYSAPMPYGPAPIDNIQQLMWTAESLGYPPPDLTTRQISNQGFIGLVVVGGAKYKGALCSTREEAMQSASAIANITLKPAQGPPHPLLHYPMLLPMPPYSPSNIGGEPAYFYSPQTQPLQAPVVHNPFIPLQAQRRTPKSTSAISSCSEVPTPARAGGDSVGADLFTGTTQPSHYTMPPGPTDGVNVSADLFTGTTQPSHSSIPPGSTDGVNVSADLFTGATHASHSSIPPGSTGGTGVSSDLGATRLSHSDVPSSSTVQESSGEKLEVVFAHNKEASLTAAETGSIVSEAVGDSTVTRVEGGAEVRGNGEFVGDTREEKKETEPVPLEEGGTGLDVLDRVEEGDTGGGSVDADGDCVPVGGGGDDKTISSEGGDTADSGTGQADFLTRIEEAQKSNVVIQEQVQRLTQMLGVLQTTVSDISSDQASEDSMDRSRPASGQDAIVQAALISSLDDDESVVVKELHQPSNSGEVDDSEVVVVGEIISGDHIQSKIAATETSRDSSLGMRGQQSEEEVVVPEPSGAVSNEQSSTGDMPPLFRNQPAHKRSKLQLAASFKQ